MPRQVSAKRTVAAVTAERERLYELLDRDPRAAIEAAQRLRPRGDLNRANVEPLRGMVLIDAGGQLNDAVAVTEGVDVFRRLSARKMPDSTYNLANGLAELARLQGTGKRGRLDTAHHRQEVRMLFQQAADESKRPSIRSASLTNLANQLKDSYRWIEAYDGYAAAINEDPANSVALSGIAALLRWRMRQTVEADGPMRRAAVRYLLKARARLSAAHAYAGPRGVTRIEELLKEFQVDDATVAVEELPPVAGYAAFVRRHRLALCVDVEGVGADMGRWDHLTIRSVTQPIETAMKTPLIFSSWNVLKADFLATRWLAYTALESALPETGAYTDTLDYALYGMKQSLLVLAQKAAVDVLDKVAAAANVYLNLGHNPQVVYFGTCWHELDKAKKGKLATPLKWVKAVGDEVAAGNDALIALTELAHDFHDGYLKSKKYARNAGTHRLVVLHDLWAEGRATPSTTPDRRKEDEFGRMAIESLQVARAALFYFQEVVSRREHRLRESGKGVVATLVLPPHHYIRGEE